MIFSVLLWQKGSCICYCVNPCVSVFACIHLLESLLVFSYFSWGIQLSLSQAAYEREGRESRNKCKNRCNISQVGYTYTGHFLVFISLSHTLTTRFTGVCRSEIHTHRCAHINSARALRFQHYQCTDTKHYIGLTYLTLQ